MAVTLCIVVFSVLCLLAASEQPQHTLNVPQVLLPYAARGSVNANFTLKTFQGCYTWISNRPEVATVEPLYSSEEQENVKRFKKKCSKEAVITVQSRQAERQITEVLAEEEVTGMVLRCVIFVDKIRRLEIMTTTRELLLGESPEVFHVKAFDEEDNLFSTLEGLVFDWDLITVEGNGSVVAAQSIIKILPFDKSSYKTTPEIYLLESKGLKGSSIIVEPINTGTAIVRAKLHERAFEDVPPAQVKLIVLDNVMLRPSHDMYILVNTSISYSVVRMQHGRMAVVLMPSAQFEFKLSNVTVGDLDVAHSSVTGVQRGYTQMVLVDKNMLHIPAAHQPSAGIYVVEPASIGFSIVPDSNWVLQVGVYYAISVQLYNKDNHKINMADNTYLDTTFSDQFFEVLWSSKNGSYHHVRTLTKGKTTLKSLYTRIKIPRTGVIHIFENPISGQQEAEIFDPVVVVPEILVFPWYPEPTLPNAHQYHHLLKPSGGSGTYIWTSSNTTVSTVNTKGLVMTTSGIGYTEVKAADVRNTEHFDVVDVYVLQPRKMEFIPSQVEARVGSVLVLPLAVAACTDKDCQEFHIFSDCRSMSLTYTLSDASVFRVVEGKDDYEIGLGSCMSVYLEALRSGFAVLTVTYQYKEILLKASINVGAYLPLKVLDPIDVGVVTLCSIKNLLLEGGPAPWILDSSGFYKDVTAEKDDEIVIRNYATADYQVDMSGSLHYFNVMCKALGEQILKIKIGNQPSPKNPYPASSEVQVRFACMLPASATLVPVIKLPEVDGRRRSPENCVSSNKEIHVRNNQDLKLILHLRDVHGRLFDNFTSLSVSWSSSNSSLAQFLDLSKSVHMMFHHAKDDEDMQRSLSYQTAHLFEKMGAVLIRATVEGYDCVILRQCGLELKKPVQMALQGHLKLLLVPERKVLPQKATILNYPENMVKFLISGGSGHFAVKGSDAQTARVIYQGKAEITVVPKAEGLFTVSVNDLCLDSPVPALVNVQVSDIYGVDVVVVNKIGLGESVILQLRILDMFGSPMLLDSFSFLQLVPHFTPDILVIRREPSKEDLSSPYRETAYFTVRGGTLGTASLTFTASTASGKSATSEPRDIQVFASLRLDPRVVVMVRGATFQVRATGGPTPQTATVFSVANETVSTVSSVGLVEAMNLGSTNLTGVVQVSDPQMGQTFVYSKDKVIIYVVELTGVKIFVTSTSLVTGTKISLYAVGLNDESPFTFANAVPGLKFHWSSTNPDVCQVQSVYSKSGISVENENDFRVDLHCINSGQTTIRMEMEVTNPHYNQVLPNAVHVDEVTFQVYERLQLVFPVDGFFLLPHNVNTRIRTNRDGSAVITYELITGCDNRGNKATSVLSVDKNGRLYTHAVSGTAAVLVTVHEEFGGNQTVLVHVEVKPVASLSISCQSYVRASSDKLQAFPLGMNAQFIIYLHDNIGRRFHSASVPLKYRLNRFDAVHIVPGPDNGTLYVKAMTIGEAILKVWDSSSPHIADYVRIRVDQGLTPTKAALLLGMVQTFSTSVMSEGQGGLWSSSNNNIVNINSTTGVALAASSGTTIVYYKIPDVYSAQTEVKVERPTFVRISVADPNLIITNWPLKGSQGYVIPVVLGNHVVSSTDFRGAVKEGIILYEELGVKAQAPVRCFLSFSDEFFTSLSAVDLFDVKPGLISGKLMCYVIPKKSSADAAHIASTGDAPLNLLVKVHDGTQGYEVSSDSLVLPFVPAFVVSKSEVELTSSEMKKRLVVTGTQRQLDNLVVRSLDESLVVVNLVTASDDKQAEFTIAAADNNLDPFENVAIEFKSSLTKQRVLVYVSYSPPPIGVPVPVSCLGQTCPTKPVEEPSKGLKGLLLVLLAETSAWLIGFSIIIGLVILLLICLCNPRHRGGAHPPGVTTPSPALRPGVSPIVDRTPGGATPGSAYPGDQSYASSPRHHFKHTLHETTRRTFVSDEDKYRSGGSVPLGRVSPGRSPNGLFSVTQ